MMFSIKITGISSEIKIDGHGGVEREQGMGFKDFTVERISLYHKAVPSSASKKLCMAHTLIFSDINNFLSD